MLNFVLFRLIAASERESRGSNDGNDDDDDDDVVENERVKLHRFSLSHQFFPFPLELCASHSFSEFRAFCVHFGEFTLAMFRVCVFAMAIHPLSLVVAHSVAIKYGFCACFKNIHTFAVSKIFMMWNFEKFSSIVCNSPFSMILIMGTILDYMLKFRLFCLQFWGDFTIFTIHNF